MIIKVPGGQLIIDESLIEEPEEEIRKQIEEFLDGERREFDLEYSFPGGGLGYVLRVISQISYGETRTYSEIAEEADTSAIAVGNYCGKNPLPLIIPCHRVVGKNNLGGYQAGEAVKRKLLDLEAENQH